MEVTDADSLFIELLGAGKSKSFIARNHKGELIAVDYLNDFYSLSKDRRKILESVWKNKYKHFKFRSKLLDLLTAVIYILSAVMFFYGYTVDGWFGAAFVVIGISLMFVSVSIMPDFYKASADRVKDVGRVYRALKIRN